VAYRDWRHFVKKPDSEGERRWTSKEINRLWQITEIFDRAVKAGGPAPLFGAYFFGV